MADLLAMFEAIVDGKLDAAGVGPISRINHQLSEIADGIAMVEAFSHCVLFQTDDGLAAFDTSNHLGGARVVEEIRRWRPDRFNTIVYTHGQLDHVGDCGAFIEDAEGESDDHTRSWIPHNKAICAGDFFIWNCPNAGHPQKVRRYPVEWALATRDMAAQGAEQFLPISGAVHIRKLLESVADTLDILVGETLAMMNAGERLNEVIHTVKIDPAVLETPWLRPLYDEPEFVIRNIWRLYGGWWDDNPANLKPARDGALAAGVPDEARAGNLTDGQGHLRLRGQSVDGQGGLSPE